MTTTWRAIAKKAVTPSGYYQPRQQYTIQYNNRHYIHNKKTETDRKRLILIQLHYSKIYGSKAVGRRRLRTGREEPTADCDCESVSPQDWLSSSIPGGVDCPRRVCPVRQSRSGCQWGPLNLLEVQPVAVYDTVTIDRCEPFVVFAFRYA